MLYFRKVPGKELNIFYRSNTWKWFVVKIITVCSKIFVHYLMQVKANVEKAQEKQKKSMPKGKTKGSRFSNIKLVILYFVK